MNLHDSYDTIDILSSSERVRRLGGLFFMRKTKVEVNNVNLTAAKEAFLKYKQVSGCSVQTIKTYDFYISYYLEHCSDPTAIQDYILFLSKTNSNSSIRTHIRHLKIFLGYCFENSFLAPFDIPTIKKDVTYKEPYSKDEIRRLIRQPLTESWTEWRTWGFINFAIGTGMRLSTILNIKLENIDFINKTVFLEHNKDRRQKVMPLSDETIKRLRGYISVCGITDGYLFQTYEGKQMKPRSIQQEVYLYNKRRGVSKTSIHLFRHTFATNYILNNGNVYKLSKLLNHKDISTTMGYIQCLNVDLQDDLNRYGLLDTI